MSDNTPQQGTDTIASDDIGGVKFQRVKVNFGADGSTSDASLSNPLPANVANLYLDETGATLTVKRAFANVAASATDSNIVTAVGGKRIRVVAAVFECGATATTITFNSKPAGAGTAVSMQFQNDIYSGAVLPFLRPGWFQTTAGEGLTVTTGAGSTTGVQVVYVEAT
jgi:hypothetical protein